MEAERSVARWVRGWFKRFSEDQGVWVGVAGGTGPGELDTGKLGEVNATAEAAWAMAETNVSLSPSLTNRTA